MKNQTVDHSIIKKNHGVIEQCTIYLENEEQSAIVMMNTESGANLERIEIQAETGTFSLQNLTDLTIYQGGEEIKDHFHPGILLYIREDLKVLFIPLLSLFKLMVKIQFLLFQAY